MSGKVPKQGSPQAAFSLLEVIIAMSALLIGALGFSQAIYSWSRAADGSRTKTQAFQAARSVIEDLQSRDFDEVFALYNTNPDDDPGGVVVPGASFTVRGLSPWPGDPDGIVGEVVFPTAGTGALEELREDAQIPELGMPRDLDADGVVDSDDHANNYRLLPVLVRVRWLGAEGRGEVELKTVLGEFL